MFHPSRNMTSRTDCTCTSDGNGDPPPRSRIPGAHRAPSSSSRRPPCFHLRGRGSKEARRKHVTKRPSRPAAARRSSSVAEVPLRYGALRAPIGCRSTSRNVREPLSRSGRFAAATRTSCPTRAPSLGGSSLQNAARETGSQASDQTSSGSRSGALLGRSGLPPHARHEGSPQARSRHASHAGQKVAS
jgi:hypothetical protein